ncbi:alcohol dehydrogenase class-3 [Bisporella sp. PMI_857]|nr:alcohol dehydrogenase class-3 [Bisporella sp. PMI_857]
MTINRAIVVEERGKAGIAEVPVPKLRDDYINIEVKAVALNPTDWKHIKYVSPKNARIGCDYSGIVEEVGSAVTKDFKKGDRIAGFVHGGNPINLEDGGFGNYITAKGDIQIKVPENLSLEEAATLGVGIGTVGQGLYQSLKLPLPTSPSEKKFPLLIYGGSTATGILAIQFAKLSGLEVITTCSPRNFEYVKSLGADAVFDYNSPTVSADIKAYTKNSLAHAFDCISEGDSPKITLSAMASGTYSALLKLDPNVLRQINPDIEYKHTMVYTTIGEDSGWPDFPASQEDFEFAKTFWELSRELLAQGKIKVHKPSVDKYGGGFEGILAGLKALEEGKVSGEKLVFRV